MAQDAATRWNAFNPPWGGLPPLPGTGLEAARWHSLGIYPGDLAVVTSAAIPATELAAARVAILQVMTDTFELHRPPTEPVPDGQGGWTEEPVLLGTTKGRAVSRRAIVPERAFGGAPQAVTTWEVWLPYGTDVRPKDVLVKGVARFQVGDDDDVRTDGVAVVAQATLTRAN